jgi:hypothetical protein
LQAFFKAGSRYPTGPGAAREIVVWEGVDDLDRDVGDSVGVPERADGVGLPPDRTSVE